MHWVLVQFVLIMAVCDCYYYLYIGIMCNQITFTMPSEKNTGYCRLANVVIVYVFIKQLHFGGSLISEAVYEDNNLSPFPWPSNCAFFPNFSYQPKVYRAGLLHFCLQGVHDPSFRKS